MLSNSIERYRQSTIHARFFTLKTYSTKLPLPQKTILLSGPGMRAFNNEKILKLEKALIKHNVGPIVRIGDGETCLTDNDLHLLLHEISNNKMRIMLFIMAHGTINTETSSHMLYLKNKDMLTPSVNFMEAISAKLAGKAIDIFSTACYSGVLNSHAEKILPQGSTYVSLSPPNQPSCSSDVNRLINVLASNNKVKENLTAKKLLFAYLTNALENRVPPLITSSKITSNLRSDFLNHIGEKFSESEKELIYKTFGNQTNNVKLNRLINLIEMTNTEYAIKTTDYGLALAICHAASGKMSLEHSGVDYFRRRNYE